MTEPSTPRDRFFVSDKDPDYVYRWCNEKERVMLERIDQGFEVAKGKEVELPVELRPLQTTETPTAGTVRRRGDVILMRCRRDVFEARVLKPREAQRERQKMTVDTMIHQANEHAQRDLRKAGYRDDQVRKRMMFSEDSEPKIGG